MTDARKPTYDQLSALCAQMAAALFGVKETVAYAFHTASAAEYLQKAGELDALERALTAYRTLSPDPQWQRVPEGAASEVLAERRRQIEKEGWTLEHDDEHGEGQMASAAACYALASYLGNKWSPVEHWPWDAEWWKPKDRRRNLIVAAALIFAEIERLDRARGEG